MNLSDHSTIEDEHAVQRLVVQFSLAMDACDTARFRAVWADEVELDLRVLAADAIALTGVRRADDYTQDVVTLLSGFTATQHLSSNHLVTVDGDDAECVCYTHAVHYLNDDGAERWLTAGSRYRLAASRFPDVGWRLTRFRSDNLFVRGDRTIWEAAAAGPGRRPIS